MENQTSRVMARDTNLGGKPSLGSDTDYADKHNLLGYMNPRNLRSAYKDNEKSVQDYPISHKNQNG